MEDGNDNKKQKSSWVTSSGKISTAQAQKAPPRTPITQSDSGSDNVERVSLDEVKEVVYKRFLVGWSAC